MTIRVVPARAARCSARDAAGPEGGRRQGGRHARRAPRAAAAGRRCRARCSRAWSRTRSGCSARRLAHGSAVISATNGKTTTAAMVAAILERTGERLVHNRAGANMAGGVASALAAAARRGGRELDGDLGLFEVDEFWLGAGRAGAAAARAAARQPVPRPARPLRRARDHRRALGRRRGARARAPTALVLNADDPLVADLGRERGARSTSASRTTRSRSPELQHAADSKHCRRCGHPYAYEAIYLAHLGRYALPELRRRAGPSPPSSARDVELRGIRSARVHARTPAGTRARRAAAARALQRLQRARRRGAVPRARARRWTRSSPGCEAVAPAFGRAETLDLGGRPTSILLVKNPAGRQRGAAHARARGRASSTCSACSTTTPPTGATSRGSGTPTGSCSRRSLRRMTCSGTRAAELALRLKYAGVAGGAAERRRRSCRPALDARAGGRRRAAVRAADLHRAARAARPARPARPGAGALAMSAATSRRSSPGTTSSAAATRADLPLWRELAARRGAGRCSTSARAPGASRSTSPRAGHTVDRARPRARAARPRWRARADAGSAVETAVGRRRGVRARRRFGLVIVPMQTIQLLPERAGFLARRAAHLAPGGLLAIAITDGARGLRASSTTSCSRARRRRPSAAGASSSQPTAVRALPDGDADRARAPRRRPRRRRDREEDDVIELAHARRVEQLEAEGRAAGLRARARARRSRATADHVGSEVVLLRA